LPAAASSLEQLTAGGFLPVIDDAEAAAALGRVRRIVLCSGKVFYDLNAARKKSGDDHVAIIRLEQFYPFPEARLREIFQKFPNATQLVWTQEEPKNMGGWTFVEPRLMNMLNACQRPFYVGRAASASPATGSYTIHELEQRRLVEQALTKDDAAYISDASTKVYAGQADS
jgi:2-oxoglutarate dehydrogenase E1 component